MIQHSLTSGEFQITLEKKGKDTGTVRVGEAGKKPKATKLYAIRSTPTGIVCKADVFGRDPQVTFTLGAADIRVEVKGAIIADTDTLYPAPAKDIAGLRQFLAVCGFPKA